MEGFLDPLPVEKLMMRECPSSTKTREVLGNPSPLPSRFPSTLKISLRLRPRDIFRVLGNLLGIRDGFPNTSLVLMEDGPNPMQSMTNPPSQCQSYRSPPINHQSTNPMSIHHQSDNPISLLDRSTNSSAIDQSITNLPIHHQSKAYHTGWFF